MNYAEVRPWARAIKTKVTSREMPPWHIDRSIGEYSNDPSLSDKEVALIAAWVDAGAPEGRAADAPPAKVFTANTEWTYGEPDLVVRMAKGFRIPAQGPDFIPEEHVDPGLTEDRYVKWVQIIPDAWRAVHHAHVYVDLPEGTDKDGLGLGMGSNGGNSMDLIEYGAGNDADIFPDGTTKILKKGSIFRFEGHYHPYGEEQFDRMRVGIKFYPRGYTPEHVVTSHRIRTGVGNDWVLNRERVEDLLLRAGHKLSIDEPTMPTGALIAEVSLSLRPGVGAAVAGRRLPAPADYPGAEGTQRRTVSSEDRSPFGELVSPMKSRFEPMEPGPRVRASSRSSSGGIHAARTTAAHSRFERQSRGRCGACRAPAAIRSPRRAAPPRRRGRAPHR